MTEAEGFELYKNSSKVSKEMQASVDWLTGRLRDTDSIQEAATLIEAAGYLTAVYTAILNMVYCTGGLKSLVIWRGLLLTGGDIPGAIDDMMQEMLNALVRLDAPESVTDQVTVALNQLYNERPDRDHPRH